MTYFITVFTLLVASIQPLLPVPCCVRCFAGERSVIQPQKFHVDDVNQCFLN